MSDVDAAVGPVEPDTKDWTWVLQRPCPECGTDPGRLARVELAALCREDGAFWAARLADPDCGRRPAPGVWSPLEYAGHVRDVHRRFAERVGRMLHEQGPVFENWDQDATALAERYDLADARVVARELASAADAVAAVYDGIDPEDDTRWQRPGERSDGSTFTVESLGRYHLHDVLHHRWDVGVARSAR